MRYICSDPPDAWLQDKQHKDQSGAVSLHGDQAKIQAKFPLPTITTYVSSSTAILETSVESDLCFDSFCPVGLKTTVV